MTSFLCWFADEMKRTHDDEPVDGHIVQAEDPAGAAAELCRSAYEHGRPYLGGERVYVRIKGATVVVDVEMTWTPTVVRRMS